jgi:hypothetical protein
VSGELLFDAGYALLLWGASWGLRRRAQRTNATWVESERVGFERKVALVPLLVAEALLGFGLTRASTAVTAISLATLLVAIGAWGVGAWRADARVARAKQTPLV